MKQIRVVLAIALMVGAAWQANAAGLKCSGPDGKTACTANQVAALNQGIATGRRMHEPLLADVKGVTQGKNGMLQCTQSNGSACTDEQLSAIIDLAASAHSKDGPFHINKTVDSSSPM